MRILALLITFCLSTAVLAESREYPPKLGSEQLIFMYYAKSGEEPPFEAWDKADPNRSRIELEKLYTITKERNDIDRFHRELELALYGYNPKEKHVPLGSIKATFISTPLAAPSNVKVVLENAAALDYWKLEPKAYKKMVKDNDDKEHYIFKPVLAFVSAKDRVLTLRVERMDIYTKNGKIFLGSVKAD